MKAPVLTLALGLLTTVASAQPWIPTECKARHEEQRNEFTRKMRDAEPGSPIYAPKPFPKTNAEVLADFEYGYGQMFKGMRPEEVPQEDWPLYTGLQRKSLSFRILRVENWAPDRCRPDQPRDFYYLLHITDSASGQEVARAIVNQSGLLGGWGAPPDAPELQTASGRAVAAPSLEAALSEVQSRFGIKGSRAQYVATWGNPQCAMPLPCVAFQAGGKSYLFQNGSLVEFTPQSRGYTRAQMDATRTRRFEISNSVDTDKEWLVSIGDDRWILAKRLKPRP